MRRIARAVLIALAVLAVNAAAAGAATREVVLVANAEGGTVSVVDAHTFAVLREVNVLPDGPRATVGEDDPAQALAGQRLVEAAGGENFAQDQDLSPDGRTLYVSRGHRGDVAAFDLASGELRWKVPIEGLRADHMTLSADGSRLYVSALTANRVEVVDTARAAVVGSFATGEWPHDNHVSHDGERLYNASIGSIVTPRELREPRPPGLGAVLPEPYQLTVVDPDTLQVQRTHVFERGIRPFVITDDESRLYAQLSFLHGIVEYDLREGRVLRRVELPIDPGVTEEDFDFEAPHHGLALSGDERTLCAAGRASDYVALVPTATMAPEAIIEVGDAPGWATTSPDGRLCFVPNTREDTLSVISFAQRREVARIRVGDGPKHLEAGRIPAGVPELRLTRRCAPGGRLHVGLRGDTAAVRDVNFKLGRRLARRDTSAPFRATLPARTVARTRARRLRAVAYVHDGPRQILARRLPDC